MPNVKRRQQEIPGAEKPTDDELDELALPLLDAMEERDSADEKIGGLRLALLNRMSAKKVEVYRVEDGARSATIKIKSSSRLSIRVQQHGEVDVEATEEAE